MPPTRRAVIDIGTNSVKLLVAEVAGNEVNPLWEEGRQTRLGKGFYETRQLRPDAIAKTAEVVTQFATTARDHGAVQIRVIATSAARDAINARELTDAIEHASPLKVEIISGEQEADLAFQGVTSNPAFSQTPLLLLDLGGGSTEFILGRGERKHFRQSFPLGAVRLLEKIPHSDPPTPAELAACRHWLDDFLSREVRPVLDPALRQETALDPAHRQTQLVGTGGTAGIMAGMELGLDKWDRARIETARLRVESVRTRAEALWALPLAARRQVPGLPAERADVILTGVLIYEAVMRVFEFAELRVSTRGLRFAAVMEAA